MEYMLENEEAIITYLEQKGYRNPFESDIGTYQKSVACLLNISAQKRITEKRKIMVVPEFALITNGIIRSTRGGKMSIKRSDARGLKYSLFSRDFKVIPDPENGCLYFNSSMIAFLMGEGEKVFIQKGDGS